MQQSRHMHMHRVLLCLCFDGPARGYGGIMCEHVVYGQRHGRGMWVSDDCSTWYYHGSLGFAFVSSVCRLWGP